MTQTSTPSIAYQPLQLNLLSADPDQVRKHFDEESLDQLGASIKTHGLVEPIIVRPSEDGEGYQIISGERRFRAAQRAGITALPAIVRADLVGEDVGVLQIIENLQREDLKLPELMHGIKRLVDAEGLAKAAELLSKSKSWVSKRARPDDLVPQVAHLVESGVIEDIEQALDLSTLHALDEDTAAEFIEDFEEAALPEDKRRPLFEGRPTREQLRTAINSARSRAEAQEQQRIEHETAKAEAATKPGDKKPSREQVQTKIKVDRKAIAKQAEALNAEAEAHKALMLSALYKTLSLKPPKDAERGPITLWHNKFHEYSNPDGLPKTSAGVEYHLGLAVDLPTCRKFEKALGSLEIRAELPDDLSLDDLEKLGKALPGRITYSANERLSGNKLAKLIEKLGGDPKSLDTTSATDQLKKFLADCTTSKKGEAVKSAEVYKAYQRWCTKHKLKPDNLSLFGAAIAKAGITSHRLKTGVHYQALMLTGLIK